MSSSVAELLYPMMPHLWCWSVDVGVYSYAAEAGGYTTTLEGIVSERWQAWPLTRESSGGLT